MPSSVIRAMRFDPVKSVLEIVFRGARGAYRYFDVPVEEWRRFREAPSKGEYLNSFFKNRQFAYEKLSGPVPVEPKRKQPTRVEVADESLQWGEPVAFPKSPDRKPRVDPAEKIRSRVSVQQEMRFDFEDAA